MKANHKRILSLVLALVMILTTAFMASRTFAEDVEPEAGAEVSADEQAAAIAEDILDAIAEEAPAAEAAEVPEAIPVTVQEATVLNQITAQPQDVTVSAYDNAVFTVGAEGEVAYVQWQVSKDGGNSWADMNSWFYGNGTALTLSSVASSNSGYQYRAAVVFADGTTAVSAAALLTVVSPYIAEQPKNAAVAAGETAVFATAVSGKVSSYQWQVSKDGGLNWSNLSAWVYGSAAELSYNAGANDDGYLFRCVVTFADWSKLTTDAALLTVAESYPERVLEAPASDADAQVVVAAPEGALPAQAELEVTGVAAEDVADQVAEVTAGDAADLLALDISFTTGEPNAEVEVTITSDKIAENADKAFTLVHIKDDGTVEIVENAEIVDGALVFTSGEFSTYAIVWADEAESATIHWGTYEGDTFTELESTTTIDSTAASVSLNVAIDGYYFVGAEYKATEDAEPQNLKNATIKKADDGWHITLEDGTDAIVADGSHIYVNYALKSDGQYTPPAKPDQDTIKPETTKTVSKNADGTYTIQLDIEGHEDEEVTQIGANVIVVMDITQSMTNNMPGGGTRMAAAKQALTTLIDTLKPSENVINFTAVNFGNSADYSNGVSWTTEESRMRSYVSGLPNNPTDMGTCWQAGLTGGLDRVNSAPAGNETYVLFVTDGNPNCYEDNRGNWHSASGPNFNQQAYNAAVPIANQLGSSCHFYGIFCGDADGYDHLEDLITNANGVDVINGNTTSAIEDAFAQIAQTIIDNLGTGSVVVDDGIPSLSNISANVTAGEAGGFEYYITPAGESQSKWDEAPGASYDKTNGVTWNLSEAGVLKEGWVYTLKFTVWPSQAAYDLIADLNNGIRNFDDLSEAEKAGVEGSKETGYTLKTNTHLFTTFKDLEGNEYQEANDWTPAAMDLPTETISIKKNWPENMLDQYGAATYRDENGDEQTATEIQLTLERDSEEYLDVTVKAEDDWTKDGIYISCGQMTIDDNGKVTIKEPGHDYQVIEPAAFSYYWDLYSDVYHPMVINGTAAMLILNEKLTSDDVDNETVFEIDGKFYEKSDAEANTLEASNYRRSNLNLTKVVSTEGAPDEYFTYTVTVTDSNTSDGNVWFSAYDTVAGALVMDTDWVTGATAEEGNTGYWYAPNGTTLTLKIKAGWNVRFLNLYHDSTFSFEETPIPEFFELDKVEAEASEDFMDEDKADWYEIEGAAVTGTITEPNNSYTVTYTNKFEAFYVYHSGVAGDGNLTTYALPEEGETFNLYELTTPNTLYGGYYLDYADKGTYKDDGVAGEDGVVYTGWNCEWSDPQTVDGRAMTPVAGETYYIKEVPTYYLRNYHQINYVKTTPYELKGLYLISAVDDLNYNETGFTVTTEDKVANVVSSLSFKNIATGKQVTLKAEAVFKTVDSKAGITQAGEYLTYFDAKDYLKTGKFTVKPYWITPDKIQVHGISTRTITISDLTKAGITKSDD